jgi:error-prone DNA polymerase
MPKPVEPADYVELRCRSAFSFLDGATLPEELVRQASALGYRAVALADRDGVYGAPRFFGAARQLAEQAEHVPRASLDESRVRRWPLRPLLGATLTLSAEDGSDGELLVLVEDRAGYRNLCRLLTSARLAHNDDADDARTPASRRSGKTGKVEPRIPLALLGEHAQGLVALVGGGGGRDPVGRAAAAGDDDGARRALASVLDAFGPRGVYMEIERHLDPDE